MLIILLDYLFRNFFFYIELVSFFFFTHLRPKSNVDLVSDSLNEAGEQQIIIVVRAFPPNDSCNIRVNFESR